MEELMIKVENVTKKYRLGAIGGTTLRDDLQRLNAKIFGREDPTLKIGQQRIQAGTLMALRDINLEVKKGEAVGIIGHNGAGKSTLLKLITRVTGPTEGRICLNGRVASMLEVGTGFHQELTGRENIYINGAILGMTKKEIDSKIEDIIEFSECRDFIDTPVKRYSSGMYIKLAFSVAAHLDSEILIMDEVLAVGDVAFQNKCIKKMRDVANSGRTILYVSHNMSTIRSLCDRCVVLNKGQIEYEGDVEESIRHYVNTNFDVSPVRDLSNAKRNGTYLVSNKAHIEKFELIGKETAVFSMGETMPFTLAWTASKDFDNMGMRIGIWSASGMAVGIAFSDYFSGKADTVNETRLNLDISTLLPGKYYLELILNQLDEYGGLGKHDTIREAFSFEVVVADTLPQYNGHNSSWGYNRTTCEVIG